LTKILMFIFIDRCRLRLIDPCQSREVRNFSEMVGLVWCAKSLLGEMVANIEIIVFFVRFCII